MLVFVNSTSFTTFNMSGFHELGGWRSVLSIPFLLMFLLSFISNSMLLYLIISKKALHSPMCVLIGLLAFVDLCMPAVVLPNMLISLIFNWNQISLVGCLIQMFFIHFIGTFQSTILLWMALDRFFAICRPLNYHKYMGMNAFLTKFVVLPLIRNIALVAIMVIWAGKVSYCSTNVIDHCFCEHMALVQLACGDTSMNNIIGLSAAFLILTTDCVLTAVSYVLILISVLKSGKASLKAFNTCTTHIIVMLVGLVLALTAFLSYRIRNNLSSSSRIFLSTMYVLFPSCFNPIIYGVRTKEIRVQFLKVISQIKFY